jgi:hypothetical protein
VRYLKEKQMSYTTLNTTQNAFLEGFLRGTNRSISSAEARRIYGIKNLRARMSELRQAGLRVRREREEGQRASEYKVSQRDVFGSRAQIFA